MISQILPHLVDALSMVRVSEFGEWSELSGESLRAMRLEPLSGVYPEAIEIRLSEEIPLDSFLRILGFACMRHKALLKADSKRLEPMPSARVSIHCSHGILSATVVMRRRDILLIIPSTFPI